MFCFINLLAQVSASFVAFSCQMCVCILCSDLLLQFSCPTSGECRWQPVLSGFEDYRGFVGRKLHLECYWGEQRLRSSDTQVDVRCPTASPSPAHYCPALIIFEARCCSWNLKSPNSAIGFLGWNFFHLTIWCRYIYFVVFHFNVLVVY